MVRQTITDILGRWDVDHTNLGVRVVAGDDGRAKLQVRVELGLLQLEMDDRPDGQRPHGCASLLDYHIQRLEDYRTRYGTVDGYRLPTPECEALCREAAQFYHRYVSLQQLGRFVEVARDTARNLRAVDFVRRYAGNQDDSWQLEQYRPYITMMNSLARAETHTGECDYAAAERVLATAMATIRHFGSEHVGQVDVSRELDVLGRRLREIQSQRPRTEIELLQRRLDVAVEREDYEAAAGIRDELQRLVGPPPASWL